jgi:hypothetical protein
MIARKLARAVLLVAALSGAACEGHSNQLGFADKVKEEITRRDVLAYGTRVDVTAVRSGTGNVEATVTRRRTCRARVEGTSTRYRERTFWVSDGDTPGAPPKTRVEHEWLKPTALLRWDGEPFPCDGAAAERIEGIPVVARYTFARAASALEARGVSDAAGLVRFEDGGRSLATAFCGGGVLAIGVDPAAMLADGATPGTATELKLDVVAHPVTVAEIARVGQAGAAVAGACCRAERGAAAQDPCEERCARAGQVHGCLFSRRACGMKAERTADVDATKGLELCQALYAECLVANGTSAANVGACTQACKEQRVEQECR